MLSIKKYAGVLEQLVALAPVRKGRERKRERKRGIEFVITE